MLPSLGAGRHYIHPASVDGRFTRLTRIIGRLLIAFLLIAPWIRIGGAPLLLADLATRQFSVVGQVFTPRDSVLLLTVLMGAGFALFFVTSLWGRIWCGYACPQTVLLDGVIRRIEAWTDGERGARLRLQESPWTLTKVRKRLLKWTLFGLVSVGVTMSFMGFFADPYRLWTLQALPATYAVTGVLSLVLFLDFAWFREQFCHYLCPYARLQGVMTDDHTVQIGYDFRRGEPRKPRGMKLSDLTPDIGACVDCNRCVAVCPSGIDIREGFQLECIACARCVDACTDVLGKLGQETLVKYGSLAEFEGRETGGLRVRPMIYAAIILLCGVVFAVTALSRTSFDVTIAQDPRSAEISGAAGEIRNMYQLTIHNNSKRTQTFEIETTLPDAQLVVPGGAIVVPAAGRRLVPAFVTFEAGAGPAQPITPFEFLVHADGQEVRHAVTFRNRLQAPP